MTRKNVTWSPVVTSVSRPTSTVKRTRRKRSVLVFEHAGRTRRVEGNLVAHSRRNTHTTLLTIRNADHRDMQMLVDLPERCVRKIYDGESSFTVDDDASDTMHMRVERFGTITWKDDDDTIRRPDARGFCLMWLKKQTQWPVRTGRQKTCDKHNVRATMRRTSRRSRRSRHSRRR